MRIAIVLLYVVGYFLTAVALLWLVGNAGMLFYGDGVLREIPSSRGLNIALLVMSCLGLIPGIVFIELASRLRKKLRAQKEAPVPGRR